jgi:hypothetical protein
MAGAEMAGILPGMPYKGIFSITYKGMFSITL